MKDDEWEVIFKCERDEVQRFAVPGGWLYRTLSWDGLHPERQPLTATVTFVPRPTRGRLGNDERS